MKQKAKRILVVMLTVMIIFGHLAPLVADEANAASADLDLCDYGCESEHCDGDHCDGGHYDEEINNGGHCDEEYCDGVICDGDNCDGDCHDEHCGDCECENGHCDEQCDVISSEEVSSSSSVGRRAKAEAVCNHVWKTEVSKQPGCTTAGVYVTRCIKCRAYAQNGNGYIAPLGHKWKRIVTKQPTCTMPGTYVNKCERCNMSTTGTISALGHALSWKYKTAPTETMPGVEEYSCNICGYVANVRYIPPLGNGSTSTSVGRTVLVHPACAYNKHVWKTYTTKEPTCTTSGTYITKCSVCGAGSPNGNGYLPALGHKWNRTAPSCTQDRKCDRCGTVDKSRLGHSYAWRTKVNATCTANGTKEKYCTRSGCGYVAERQTIQALGHAWDNGTVTKEATCTATGTKTFKCTRCSATTTDEIPKAAHNCEWRVTVQASCKGAGTRQLTCKVCGTGTAWEPIQYYGDHTWVAANCTNPKTCSVCGATSGSKLDHAYAWRTPVNPTCTTVGKKEQYCTRPGCTSVVNRQDVPALNHAWDNGTVTKAATHSATGVKTFKCTRSGCSATKTESIPVIAHSYTWVVTTPSTCTKEGVESYKCNCGYVSETRPVAKKSHNGTWTTTVQPSCAGAGTEECKCSVCGTWLGSRGIQYYGDHTWNRAAADCTNDKKCAVCGYVAQKAPGHKCSTEATCTADKKCDTCGAVIQKALGHDHQTFVTKEPTCVEKGVYVSKCTRCGDIAKNGNGYITPTGQHKWKDNLEHADCTRNKECKDCGFVEEEATGHEWKTLLMSIGCSQAYGSISRGIIKNNAIDTSLEDYFADKQFECQKCHKQADYSEIQGVCGNHKWFCDEMKAATCCSSGYGKYHCTKCKDIAIDEIPINAENHDWNLVNHTAPTCTKEEYREFKCTLCGEEYTDTYPALGHKFAWRTAVDATCTTAGVRERYCTREDCGQVNKRQDIPAFGHSWEEDTTRTIGSTCNYSGKKVFVCSTCNAEKTEKIPQIDHEGKWEVVEPASETTNGKESFICQMCRKPLETRDLPTYVVTLCDNTGTGSNLGSVHTQIKKTDFPLKLDPCTSTKYAKFLGYAKKSDATEATYPVGSSYCENKDVTLFAVWKPIEYSVVFCDNTGSGSNPGSVYTFVKHYGDKIIIPGCSDRNGYEFEGYSTSQHAFEAEYKAGEEYMVLGDKTLFAVWRKVTNRKFSYDASGMLWEAFDGNDTIWSRQGLNEGSVDYFDIFGECENFNYTVIGNPSWLHVFSDDKNCDEAALDRIQLYCDPCFVSADDFEDKRSATITIRTNSCEKFVITVEQYLPDEVFTNIASSGTEYVPYNPDHDVVYKNFTTKVGEGLVSETQFYNFDNSNIRIIDMGGENKVLMHREYLLVPSFGKVPNGDANLSNYKELSYFVNVSYTRLSVVSVDLNINNQKAKNVFIKESERSGNGGVTDISFLIYDHNNNADICWTGIKYADRVYVPKDYLDMAYTIATNAAGIALDAWSMSDLTGTKAKVCRRLSSALGGAELGVSVLQQDWFGTTDGVLGFVYGELVQEGPISTIVSGLDILHRGKAIAVAILTDFDGHYENQMVYTPGVIHQSGVSTGSIDNEHRIDLTQGAKISYVYNDIDGDAHTWYQQICITAYGEEYWLFY